VSDVRLERLDDALLPQAWRIDYCHRKPLAPAVKPAGFQIVAVRFVPADVVCVINRIRVAPFRETPQSGEIDFEDDPQWWEPSVDETPRVFWRWMFVQATDSQTGTNLPVPPGTKIPVPPGGPYWTDQQGATVSYPFCPPSELTGFQGGIHVGSTRIVVRGPRLIGLLSEWDQSAIVAAPPPGRYLIAETFGSIEGIDVPEKHFRRDSLALLTG
jgi:hypothetical protein